MNVAVGAVEVTRTRPGNDRVGRALRWLPAVTVVGFVAVLLLLTGTAAADILRYALYVCWALVLPGTLCYRALRRRPHTLIEDVALGTALGFVMEIAAWAAFSLLDLRGWLWLWPLAVVVPFVSLRRLRRHWASPAVAPVSPAWAWSVAAVCLTLVTYLFVAFIRVNPPVPIAGSHLYFIDQVYLLSLVGEAKNHLPLYNPQTALEPLGYHWFTYAHEASASLISRVDTPVVHFRLFLPVVGVLSVVLMSIAGWRLTARPWVGPLSAALMFAIGELAIGSFAMSPLAGATSFITWSSNSVPYGWIYMFPLMILIGDRLARSPAIPEIGAGAWVLMAAFAIGSGGAKSSILPVLLAGLGLAAGVQLLRRRWDWPTWAAIGVCLCAELFALAIIYRFNAHGLSLQPLRVLKPLWQGLPTRPWWAGLLVVGFVFGCYATYWFTRLAGIPVWARLARRPLTTIEWVLVGGLTAGSVATLLFDHPALSQNYFVRTGFPLGAMLSALGLVALAERVRLPGRVVGAVLGGSLVTALGVSYLLWRSHGGDGGSTWRAMLPMARAATATFAIAAIAALAGRWWYRRTGRLRGIGAVAALSVLLTAGAPGLVFDAVIHPNALNYHHELVSAEGAAAMRWLRDHSSPDDLVATNHHLHPTKLRYNSFWITGFSERRFLVEAWGYVPTSVVNAAEAGTGQGSVPFWDPDLLARNDAVFFATTAENVAWMKAQGVRWLVADSDAGPVSPALTQFAEVRVRGGTMTVYEFKTG